MSSTTNEVDIIGRRLRAITSVVEFLDEHGADLLAQPHVTSYSHSGRTDVAWYLQGEKGQKDIAAQIIRIVGGEWVKSDSDITLYLRQRWTEDVEFVIAVDRTEVCERVVKGTREVTRKIPAQPAVSAHTVTETVEDVEWVCGSLLAGATS